MALDGIKGNSLGAYQYRPLAVLISTSGIYRLKPCVNLYVHLYFYSIWSLIKNSCVPLSSIFELSSMLSADYYLCQRLYIEGE